MAEPPPPPGPPPFLTAPRRRALSALWLGSAALAMAALAGELWLRVDHARAVRASERVRATNVFFANSMELNAGNRSLWRKPWRKYEPGARAEVVAGGERFVIEINRLGYRTREFSPEKPEGTARVLCIGGSTTVAGRTNDETYPALLEAGLRRRFPGRSLEVLNLGVSGVTTEQWLEWLDKLFSYEPDVIVQYQAINDISWLHLPARAGERPGERRFRESLLLERLLGFDPAVLDPGIRGTLRRFGEMNDRCRARGVAYLTATFAAPDASRASPEVRRHLDANTVFWTRHFPIRSYPAWAAILARHNAQLVDFAEGRGVPLVLVHEQLADPGLFIDVCHFTPEGIGRLAEAFLPAVAERLDHLPWGKEGRPPGDPHATAGAPR